MADSSERSTPCLYCEDRDRPKTAEHVLQKGFGGGACLHDDVCGNCNTSVFSPLDGHLIRFVHDLVCFDHPDVRPRNPFRGHNSYYDVNAGVWVSVRFDGKESRVFDQLIRVDGDRWLVQLDPSGCSDPKQRVAEMIAEAQQVRPEDVATVVLARYGLEPALVRSGPGRFLVRAATQADADRIRDEVIRGQAFQGPFAPVGEIVHEVIPEPTVQLHIRVNDRALRRGLAKITVNALCLAFGPARARAPDLALVRKFVLDGSGYREFPFVRLVTPDDPSAPDLMETAALMCPPNHHAIRFEPTAEGLHALVVLYQRPIAWVRLSWTRSSSFALLLFNYQRGGQPGIWTDRDSAPRPGDYEWDELARAS